MIKSVVGQNGFFTVPESRYAFLGDIINTKVWRIYTSKVKFGLASSNFVLRQLAFDSLQPV